ncbi:hypothetical protein GCM10027614_60650 [Micromonospora vulcania]
MLAGLDPEQRSAVTAPAGPVCILAGAGTGKTRAITSRIAHRALSGEISPRHVLAVTFTARAAAEMRSRLTVLGVGGVQARTFHAAALRQVRYFAPRLLAGRAMPELLDSKVRLVTLAAARVGLRADRAAARDLAGEIEWAKSSLVEPAEYVVAAARALRDTPHEPAKVAEVFTAYEQLKRGNGVIDFEDMLRAAVWGIEEHRDVGEQVRSQYRHFVVDEYQDVNPLQQRLLDAWLGGRDDLTVVGDASQTIYSFTGATSGYLVDFPRRHRNATVVRLVRDYRSTPQVVGLANAVIAQARGTEARLRLELSGQRPAGPEPDLRIFTDEPTEANAVAARCRTLIEAGTPAKEIAVLFRINAQSEAYEKALTEAEVPYVVQGAERFFERPEVRQAMIALRAATRSIPGETPLPAAVVEALTAVGWAPDAPRPAAPPASAGRRWPRWSSSPRSTRPPRGTADRRGGLGGARGHPGRLHRGVDPPSRPAARTDGGRGDARVPALGQGAGVGRGLPGRPRRGHPAHHVRQDHRAGRGGAPAALRRDHPGPGVALAVVRRRALVGRAAPATVAVPSAAGPLGRDRTGRRWSRTGPPPGAAPDPDRLLPDLRRHPARRSGPQAGPLPHLPLGHRR